MIAVRERGPYDEQVVREVLAESWGSTAVVSRGVLHDAATLPGLLAEEDGRLAGLLTYDVRDGELEVVTLNAVTPRRGAGRALLEAAQEVARARGLRRLWLVTTNDNTDALAFYQRCGLRLVAVHAGAVDAARALKPGIPAVGAHGIEIRDELELAVRL